VYTNRILDNLGSQLGVRCSCCYNA